MVSGHAFGGWAKLGVMNPSQNFRQLLVWQKAHAFVLGAYRCSGGFPKHELFGLTSQLRRAAVSIPANIVEGYKKESALDKARFLNIAQGSLEECRYYLILAPELKYLEPQIAAQLSTDLDEVSRLLYAYRKSVLSRK